MQKTIHKRKTYKRRNIIKASLYNFCYGIGSWPRLLLEVFIRRNFGERYFKLSLSIILAALLAIGPVAYRLYEGERLNAGFLGRYFTWYAFIGLFIYVCIQHHKAQKRSPGVFDFARFSYSAGTVNPRFWEIRFPVWLSTSKPTCRHIETLFEPGVFLLAGLFLWICRQPLGVLLMVCSVIYCISYLAAYAAADDEIMDIIDDMIVNKSLKENFIDGTEDDETYGYRRMGRRPADPELRQQILGTLLGQEDEVFEAV